MTWYSSYRSYSIPIFVINSAGSRREGVVMDLNSERDNENSLAFGSALLELAHVVKVCLEHNASAHEAIEAVRQCAEMGATKYPVKWLALDPRVHYFPAITMAVANAMLSIPEPLRQLYAADPEIRFKDLVCAVSKHRSSDGIFYVYAAVIGLNEVFRHVTVGDAVSAGMQDIADGEEDYGF